MKPLDTSHPRYKAVFHDPGCLVRSFDLVKTFGDKRALDGVEIEVRRGDRFGLLGSNGAGKTTFLRLAASLISPSDGSLYVAGYSVRIWPAMVRRRIGYLPDGRLLEERMKVHSYLEFFALLSRVPVDQRRAEVARVLDLVGLADRWGEPVRALSRGMQQRLALARMLLRKPELLLLDEPVSGLDPRARVEVVDLLRRLNQEGLTVVISSHVLHDLEEFCSRVAILEQGKLRFCGEVSEARRAVEPRLRWLVGIAGRAEEAVACAAAVPGVARARLETDRKDARIALHFSGANGDPAAVVAALVDRGIPVLSVAREMASLHDVFVHFTEGAIA